MSVAPLVGAWIEIQIIIPACQLTWSLLSWERGLKLMAINVYVGEVSRSSRGSVD